MKVWFETGKTIKDGSGKEVKCTVEAVGDVQFDEFVKKGWKPLEEKKVVKTDSQANITSTKKKKV